MKVIQLFFLGHEQSFENAFLSSELFKFVDCTQSSDHLELLDCVKVCSSARIKVFSRFFLPFKVIGFCFWRICSFSKRYLSFFRKRLVVPCFCIWVLTTVELVEKIYGVQSLVFVFNLIALLVFSIDVCSVANRSLKFPAFRVSLGFLLVLL